jgi:hypothetical protein
MEAVPQATPRVAVRSRGTHLVERHPEHRLVRPLQLVAQRVCQTDKLQTIGVGERLAQLTSGRQQLFDLRDGVRLHGCATGLL